jgi:glycosyltransferase involved in cell wall biosynthesis
MRALMLSKALVVGAYQTKLEELAQLPGLELTVIVPPYWQEGAQRLPLERAHTTGYELVVLPMVLSGHYHLHYYPGLGDVVRRVQPDIFHIDEEPYNLATTQATRLGRQHGARCIFFTWQNLYRPQVWNLAERYTLAHADAAIAGNQEASTVLRRKGFKRPIAVIPQFGVDPSMYHPDAGARAARSETLSSAISEETFVIGYIGRLVEQKGVLVLLEALSGLAGDWRLLLVGDGDLRPAIERRAKEMGVAQRLTIVSSVPSTDVPRWLNMLDCLVLPSLTRPNWKEQFGRVLVEAMACKVPVVGSDSGEIPNVVAEAGLLAREGDAADLCQRLGMLMADTALRQRLAVAGRQRVLAHYTQASVARETYAFYQQVVQNLTAS